MLRDSNSLIVLVVRQFLTLLSLAAVTIPAGRRFLGELETRSLEEELALSGTIGLGFFGTALAIAGLCGKLNSPVVVAICLIFFLGGAGGWKRLRHTADRDTRLTVAIVALPLLAIFVIGMAPPGAFDETLYHLPTARAFAESHHLSFLPQLRFPVFPQLCETIFAGVILVAGATATHVVGLYATALTCLCLAGWGRRFASPVAGRLGALAWIGCPLVVSLASASYVDLELTMFILVSLLAWEIGEITGDDRWRTVSALLAGFACATKYIALPILAGILGLAILDAARRRRTPGVAAMIAAGAGAGIWWIRSWILTGNPVFPYLVRIFGITPWRTEHEIGVSSLLGGKLFDLAGTTRGVLMAMIPSSERPIPPFSPALLVAGALGILALRTARGRRGMLAAVILLVLTRAYSDRYLLPILILVIAASMEAAAHVGRRLSPAALTLICAALLIPGLVGLARSGLRLRRIPATTDERRDFLNRILPGSRAIESLNGRFGSGYRLLVWSDENLRDFARGDFLGDWFGLHPNSEFEASMSDGRSLWTALRRDDIGWFLYDRSRHSRPRPNDMSFGQLFRPDFDDGRVELFQVVPPAP